jgi:hypothetical protein
MYDPLDFKQTVDAAMREQSATSNARGNIRVTDGVIPVFFSKDAEDVAASEEAGRPIYKAEPWIEIIVPGSRDRISCPVRVEHQKRFPEQWESYKRNEDRVVADGTPITEWQGIARTRALELRALGFYTVEQLADAGENQLAKAGADARRVQEQAQAFIATNGALESERRIRADVEAKFAEQVAKTAELAAQVAELMRKLGDDDGADNPAGGASGRTRGRNRSAE